MNPPRRVLLLLPVALLLVFGCSKSRVPSRVSGKVTYKGQPVSAGTISFNRQGEESSGVYTFTLDSEGRYSGTDLPAEEMVVTIETESANPKQEKPTYGPRGGGGGGGPDEYRKRMQEKGAPVAAGASSGKYIEIPKKYADKKTSGLKRTLTKGENSLDFDLTD